MRRLLTATIALVGLIGAGSAVADDDNGKDPITLAAIRQWLRKRLTLAITISYGWMRAKEAIRARALRRNQFAKLSLTSPAQWIQITLVDHAEEAR
jgi:hypothetical protein